MQYKKLEQDDIRVGFGSEIKHMNNIGSDMTSAEVDQKQANKTGTDAEKQVFGQIANLINGDSESPVFGYNSFSLTSIRRNNFRGAVNVPTFRISNSSVESSGSANVAGNTITESGRAFAIEGSSNSFLVPDIGIIVGGAINIDNIIGCSEETTTTTQIYIRARNQEFNYSQNPSFYDNEGYVRFPEWIDNPVVYITTIGLYNDDGDLLVVAKLPKPFKKDFTTELLTKIEIQF